MGKVAIQNIKILTKRYTASEWIDGKTSKGHVLTLDQGELGFDLTNRVLKIGTADGQLWVNAHEVCAPTIEEQYKVNGAYTTSKPSNVGNYFVSDVSAEHSATGSKITYYYDEVIIPESPSLSKGTSNSEVPTTDTVEVVKSVDVNGHTVTDNKVQQVVTKQGLDNAINPLNAWQTNHSISVTKDGDGDFITGIKEVKTENGQHTVVLESGDVYLPTVSGGVTATGTSGKTINYVKSVSVETDAQGNHIISGDTDSITIPTGTGNAGEHTATSTATVTSVALNDNQLSGTKKDIVAVTGSNISITGTDTQIQVGVDLSKYATKDELSAAVSGATHYAGTITPGTSSSPLNIATLEDVTNGALYIAVADGYIIDATNGIHDETHTSSVKTKVKIKKDDTLLLHISKTDTHWDIITSGDDIEYRPIKANGTEILGLANSSAVDFVSGNATTVTTSAGENGEQQVKFNHADTSSQGNITKQARTYVDGLTFDDYGHVTGVSVGTESNQIADGDVVATGTSVVSSVEISTDANGSHTLSGSTTEIVGDNSLVSVSNVDGNIKVSHSGSNLTTSSDTSSPKFGDTITVVSEVTESDNGKGHIGNVKTTTITLPTLPDEAFKDDDTNSTYNVDVASITNGAKINLNEKTSVKGVVGTESTVDTVEIVGTNGIEVVATDGDTITLGGKVADTTTLGLIKAISSLTQEQASALTGIINGFTGNNANRYYGVNVTPDGKAFVEVPWVDTHSVAEKFNSNSDVVKSTDLYAFDVDNYGHIKQALAVAVIDGNYSE